MFKVDEEKCVGCSACAGVCPQGAISMSNGKAKIDYANCINCGRCFNVCPQGAIYPDTSNVQKGNVSNRGQVFPGGPGMPARRSFGAGGGRGLGRGPRDGRGRGRGSGGRR